MKKILISALLIFTAFQLALGQEKLAHDIKEGELKKLSLIPLLDSCSRLNAPVEIFNMELTLPPKSDTSYWSWNQGGKRKKAPVYKLSNGITFHNCKFSDFPFAKLIFCDTVYEKNDTNPSGISLKFDHCNMDKIALEGNFKWVEFLNCEINNIIYIGGYIKEITIKDCKFSNVFTSNVQFSYCKIDHSGEKFEPMTMRTLNFLHNENLSVGFWHCKFNPNKKGHLINMGNCDYNTLSIEYCEFFEPAEFQNVKVDKTFFFINNKIDNYIDFSDFDSPTNQTTINWENIAHNIYVDNSKIDKPYIAANDSELLQDNEFNNLLATYNFFINLYNSKGDLDSKNAVYIEKKELQTKRASAQFHQHHSLYNFINLQFNNFLGWFCDYATNPVMALLNCFKIMLLFATFYFIFPSQPDHLSKFRFIGYFNKSIEYFTTEKSLSDIHKEYHHEHLTELSRFRTKVSTTKGLVPKTITFIGHLFLKAHYFVFNLLNGLLVKIDICKKSWKHIPKNRKFLLGIVSGIYFLGFVINGIIMRAVNATTLSLNSFVTLGAAGIETKGIARYVTVIEGSVGWFFLAIFSVTLITQLLQ